MVNTMVDTACHDLRFIGACVSMAVETTTNMSLTESLLRHAGWP
jgi:hypothetical protein